MPSTPYPCERVSTTSASESAPLLSRSAAWNIRLISLSCSALLLTLKIGVNGSGRNGPPPPDGASPQRLVQQSIVPAPPPFKPAPLRSALKLQPPGGSRAHGSQQLCTRARRQFIVGAAAAAAAENRGSTLYAVHGHAPGKPGWTRPGISNAVEGLKRNRDLYTYMYTARRLVMDVLSC